MNKSIIFLIILALKLNPIFAQKRTVKSCQERCSIRPSLITIEKESSVFDTQLKKMKDYNFCIQGCLGEDSSIKPVPFEKFLNLKKETANCELQLPIIFKKSYEDKYISESYKSKDSAKEHLAKAEDDNYMLESWEKKKRICQEHLDGKYDQAIYQEYFSQLKSCQTDLKSLKIPKNSYKSLEDISQFIRNRTEKRILIPNKGADAVIVARKVEDCKNEFDQLKNVARMDSVNNSSRGSLKEKQIGLPSKTIGGNSEAK